MKGIQAYKKVSENTSTPAQQQREWLAYAKGVIQTVLNQDHKPTVKQVKSLINLRDGFILLHMNVHDAIPQKEQELMKKVFLMLSGATDKLINDDRELGQEAVNLLDQLLQGWK